MYVVTNVVGKPNWMVIVFELQTASIRLNLLVGGGWLVEFWLG